MIPNHTILKRSGFEVTQHRNCPSLKKGYWDPQELTMTGDAPKDFLRVYEYRKGCRRSNPTSWPKFIAKVGHKYYPNESVTEHLITRIGQSFGLDIADSRLVHVQGQIRFLSRYFLSGTEYLVHGADIFASYLEDPDKEFIQSIEDENQSPEFFDYEFVAESVKAMFPGHSEAILKKFHRMIAFDALVGNNDRHFFNWAVICNQIGTAPPRFSPIFDTARGLFWNNTEETMYNKLENKANKNHNPLHRYCKNSFSKIGSPGGGKANHFALLESILLHDPSTEEDLNILDGIEAEPVDLIRVLFKGEFSKLLSQLRKDWICRLIEYRTQQFRLVLEREPTDV